MSAAVIVPDHRYGPLTICPPLADGEAFTSWMNRIAARNRLPLSLLLAQLTVAAGDRHSDMPTKDVPAPLLCRNSINAHDAGYPVRPGRAAMPCGHDLAEALSTHVDDLEPVTTAQQVLHDFIATTGHRDTWKDLRALTATLMYFADTGTLSDLSPDITQTLFAHPVLLDAVASVEDDRSGRAQIQQRVRAGGGDHRTGTRQRYGTATPPTPRSWRCLHPSPSPSTAHQRTLTRHGLNGSSR